MNYQAGSERRLGDRVLFSGAPAITIAIVPANEYDPAFLEHDWKDVLGEGFLIRFGNGALLKSTEPEYDEDLELLK